MLQVKPASHLSVQKSEGQLYFSLMSTQRLPAAAVEEVTGSRQ